MGETMTLVFLITRFVASMKRSQEVVENEIGHFPAEPVAFRKIETEVDSGEDSAQGRFLGCCREGME